MSKRRTDKYERSVDCNAAPFVPEGWSIAEHRTWNILDQICGSFLDSTAVGLYLPEDQKDWRYYDPNKFRDELKKQPVLNVCVLDHLLAHQDLISDELREHGNGWIVFLGTIYRNAHGDIRVRVMHKVGDLYEGHHLALGVVFSHYLSVAVYKNRRPGR